MLVLMMTLLEEGVGQGEAKKKRPSWLVHVHRITNLFDERLSQSQIIVQHTLYFQAHRQRRPTRSSADDERGDEKQEWSAGMMSTFASESVHVRPTSACITAPFPLLFQLASILVRKTDQTAELPLPQSLQRTRLPLLHLSVSCCKFGGGCILVAIGIVTGVLVGFAGCGRGIKGANVFRRQTCCKEVACAVEIGCAFVRGCGGGRCIL